MIKKMKKMRIGSYMVKNGFLTLEQAQMILQTQQKSESMHKERFGRIAVNLGYISEKVLNKIVLQKEKQEFGM